MIDTEFVKTMARYNRWQNENLYQAADDLSETARREDRGAFFRSIHETLTHILWGDGMWMSRFAGLPKPDCPIADSGSYIEDWQTLCTERKAMDEQIIDWSRSVAPDWFAGELRWLSGATGREMLEPKEKLVTHFFNHQTHHRGQVHAMLTAAGAKPHDTDLMLLSD